MAERKSLDVRVREVLAEELEKLNFLSEADEVRNGHGSKVAQVALLAMARIAAETLEEAIDILKENGKCVT